jgi:O-antigen biosynthesis protein WbqP
MLILKILFFLLILDVVFSLKRVFDLAVGLFLLALLIIPMLLIAVAVKATSIGTVFYWSNRVGQWNVIIMMPKFRTMHINTPAMASHKMTTPNKFLTPIGSFLRRNSLDELPQLFSILKGDMSFVGPRPALFNQDDLIALRVEYGVEALVPGLTGWAQINGRDDLPISEKVALDVEYFQRRSFWFDLKILMVGE